MKKIYFTVGLGVLLMSANAQQNRVTKRKFAPIESSVRSARNINHGASTMSTIWSDDFSSAATWLASHATGTTDDWSLGTTAGSAGLGTFASTTAANGFGLFDSNHGCSGNEIAYLTTATSINLSTHAAVRLNFQQLYARYADSTRIDVSTNGTTWTSFPINEQYADNGTSANPETVSVDISSVAGNQATVWIRFTYYSPSSVFGSSAGCGYTWQVDDAYIEDIPTADASITAVNVPLPDCDLTNSEPISVDVKNNGLTAISAFSLSYNVNGGTLVTETYTGSIAVGATATYTFTGTANLSASGVVQTIAASVSLTGDGNAANNKDTSYTEKLIPTIDTLSNNFDASGALLGWYFEGNNYSSWYLSGNQHTTGGSASLAFNNGGSITTGIDDWAFSTCVNLTAGTSYYLEYWGNVPSSTTTTLTCDALIETKFGSNNTSTVMTGSIAVDTINVATFAKHHHNFTVPTTGTYNIGFHAKPYQNTTWFRIDDVVLGKNSTTGIKTLVNNANLSIYPNPTNGVLNVSTTATTATLEIFNIMGQNVASKTLNNGNNTIDISSLSNGVYSVQVMQNNVLTVSKIIKTN